MTTLQTSAAEYALTLTTQLRHELARLLTLPAPQCDDAQIAMRGAEMTAGALVKLLKGNAPVIDVEPIESADAAYARVFNLPPKYQIAGDATVIPSVDTLTIHNH